MKIGIIGAGNIGGTLTRRLSSLGHDVAVANSRGPETLTKLAAETGATAVIIKEVAKDRDLVVMTIPLKNVPDLPEELFDGSPDEMVVATPAATILRDGLTQEIENGVPESRWVEKNLGRQVIKAFNNIYAEHLLERGKPAGTSGRIALPVAGDDPGAKAVVMNLVDQLGFNPVDAGSLDTSWRQQPGTPVYATDYDVEGVRRALSEATQDRTVEWRATPTR
jgi:predicted dinucleotide-binding enzyme